MGGTPPFGRGRCTPSERYRARSGRCTHAASTLTLGELDDLSDPFFITRLVLESVLMNNDLFTFGPKRVGDVIASEAPVNEEYSRWLLPLLRLKRLGHPAPISVHLRPVPPTSRTR